MALKLNWERAEMQRSWNCPWIVTHESVIGKSDDGKTWSVRARFSPERKEFMVWFDHDGIYEVHGDFDGEGVRNSIPFLRTEVVYADNYWTAHKKFYNTKFCDYDEIPSVVEAFAVAKGIR